MLPTTDEYTVPCSQTKDKEMWFRNDKLSVSKCKAVCAGCRLILACGESAIQYEELSGEQLTGTHGGMSRRERKKTTLKRIA